VAAHTYAIIDICKIKPLQRKKKRKSTCRLCHICAEVTVTGDWCSTLGGQPFILAESGAEDEIILFLSTQSNN
jgi:hypothetical protein